MNKRLAAVVCALLLVGFFGFQWALHQNPEVQKRDLALIRDTPAVIFYPVFFGFVVLAIGPTLWIMINQRRWSRLATKGSVLNAKKITLSLWKVDGNPRVIDDFVVARFRHLSFGRWVFTLPVRPGHPDIEMFRQLNDGEKVEFEALSEGMECALEHELCGFLRIKSIS
jgi:hypothetical protein